MTVDIATYLQSKGIEIAAAGTDNIKCPCFFHGEDPSGRWRLYINVSDTESNGLWTCFVCGESGGLNKLRKHFGDTALDYTKRESAAPDSLPDQVYCAIHQATTEFYHEQLVDNLEAYRYLRNERGLTIETIGKFQLGYAGGGLITHLTQRGFEVPDIERTGLVDSYGEDYLRGRITIPYHVFGQAVMLRGKEFDASTNQKYLGTKNQQTRLFNADAALEAEDLKIAEGEFDTMMLDQLGFDAVGVPGANTWKDSWTDLVEHCRRVYIIFDPDNAGKAGAEKIATKLGGKARVVTLPQSLPGQKPIDVNEWVVGHDKTREDFEYLFPRSPGGLLITVSEAIEQWKEYEGNPHQKGIRLAVETVDEQMRHGFMPGALLTLLGRTNSAKTIMTINFFHRIAEAQPELKILFVSLEQTRNEWWERARRIYSFYHPMESDADAMKFWSERIMLVDKNRVTAVELEDTICQYEYEMGFKPHFVGLDYLGYYSRGYPATSAYERVTTAVMDLKRIAKDHQVTILSPHQVNRTNTMGTEVALDSSRDSGGIEETVDFAAGLWNQDQQMGVDINDQKREIEMKVLKSRQGGVGTRVTFQFAPLTLAMVPRCDPYYHRALQERSWAHNGDSYEEALHRHRTGNQDPFLDIGGLAA